MALQVCLRRYGHADPHAGNWVGYPNWSVRVDSVGRHEPERSLWRPVEPCVPEPILAIKQRVPASEDMRKVKTGKLSAGDWVEVRSKEEILATLDSSSQLDGMPFMPEMFAFCGRRLQVYKRAHKTCDTVFPVRSRRVERAVHLETRCNGEAHGGCQAACLIFWKEAWLKPVRG